MKLNKLYRFASSDKFLQIFSIVISLLTIFAIYFRWFNFHIFSYGDWNFKYLTNIESMLHPSTWTSNSDFGSPNEFLWRAPFDFLFGLFAIFHLGMNVSEKFIVFIPIAITSFVAPFLLVKVITRNNIAAAVATVFYASNTYFLAINPQGHVLLPLAANWLTITFAIFIIAIRRKQTRFYVLTALMLWITGITDFRLFYIGVFLLVGYWLYARFYLSQRLSFLGAAALLVLTILLQISWVVVYPVVQGGGGGESMLARSLFGDAFWNLPSALALHHPFWTNTTTTWFVVNSVPIYFYIIPALACLTLIYLKKTPYVLFFGVIAILGILLSKQTSAPFTWLYPMLYKELPGFNAFREATKFYYLILLGYTVLVGLLVLHCKKIPNLKRFYPLIVLVIVTISLVNIKPNLTGSIDKLFSPKNVPTDYVKIEAKLKHDKEFYRTLWTPIPAKWAYYDNTHPRVSLLSFSQLPLYGDSAVDLSQSFDLNRAQKVLNAPLFEQYLQTTSTKYIFVPSRDVQNQDNFFQFYGDDRQFYIDTLSKLPYLKRVDMGTTDVAVFQNSSFTPRVSALATVFSVQNSANLDTLADFSTTQLGQKFIFTYDQVGKHVAGSTPLDDVFDDYRKSNVQDGKITKLVDTDAIYLAQPTPQLSFGVNSSNILSLTGVYDKGAEFTPSSSRPSESIGQVNMDGSRQYYIRQDESIIPVSQTPHARFIGEAKNDVQVIASDRKNLISNGDFERGAWRTNAEDCSEGSDFAGIFMSVKQKHGAKVKDNTLNLSALNHIACTTSNTVPVSSGQTYLLSFDYRFITTNRLSYELIFSNGQKETVAQPGVSGTPDWRTYRRDIVIPQGVTSLSLRLRSLPVTNTNNVPIAGAIEFDNVNLEKSDVLLSRDFKKPTYTAQQAGSNTKDVAYVSDSAKKQNLIKNPAFKDGKWQDEPDVCDQFKNKPRISMSLIDEPTGGSKAIELRTKARSACTGPDTIKLEENHDYLLSFDYSANNTNEASYILSFNDPERTVINESIKADASWQNYSKVVHAPIGSTSVQLKVYARPGEPGSAEVINRYGNFSFTAVPNAAGKVISVGDLRSSELPKIESNMASPTRQEINVRGAKDPFFLQYNEAFNSYWALYPSDGGVKLSDISHFKLNALDNGWYIDPVALCSSSRIKCDKGGDGTVNFRIAAVFEPQRTFNTGTLISVATLICVTSYIAYQFTPSVYKKPTVRRTIYKAKK